MKIILYNTGVMLLCIPVSWCWLKLLGLLEVKYNTIVPVEELIKESGGIELIILGVFICLLIPLAEEIIFRRVIYGGIREIAPHIFSMTVVSLIFALLHGIIFQLLPLFILGFYFQILYDRYGKLGASFFAHALNNTFAFACVLIMRVA